MSTAPSLFANYHPVKETPEQKMLAALKAKLAQANLEKQNLTKGLDPKLNSFDKNDRHPHKLNSIQQHNSIAPRLKILDAKIKNLTSEIAALNNQIHQT